MSRVTSARERVPSEERVFSLVLALVSSPQGMTRSELLSTVYGYDVEPQDGQPDTSRQRQFERDKEQIRKLGIPIEVIDSPGEPGNNQLARYRIAKERLQLPKQVRFTQEELVVLRLAALAWSDGSLGSESRWATMKVASLSGGIDAQHLGIAPRLTIAEPAAPALQAAIEERRVVRFEYQLPERDAPLLRTVAPLRLHRAESRWHLIAHDLDRDSVRVFLLSRIASSIETVAETFDAALLSEVDDAVTQMLALRAEQRAEVAVRAGTTAEARIEGRGSLRAVENIEADVKVFELGTLDEFALAEEMAGFGDEVEVRSPVRSREEVLRRLRLVRDQHQSTPQHVHETSRSQSTRGGARDA